MRWLVPAVFLSMVVCLPAFADCAAPSSPGLKICFPNEGSSVMYVAGIEMAVATASGQIHRVEVWDNGTKRANFGYLPGTLYDGSMTNGKNRVTVKVWDTDGNLYQAVRTFYVQGYGVSKCSAPGSVGINLCWPMTGSSQPNTAVPIAATARGENSNIKYVNIYVDGKFLVGQSGSSIVTGAGLSAGSHTVTARAVDYKGHVYKTSHTFKAYYNQDCNPRTGECSPGIVINQPDGPDVPTSFLLQADVQNNPKPITAIKVYVDGVAVASSNGPGISTQINFAKDSTHIVWVRAWDTSGHIYGTYQTYYAQ